jgi:hypothetical protein
MTGGMHMHAQPTHILQLLPHETSQFKKIIKSHPQTGPLALIVGVPEINRPGELVADISDVLLNAHYVSKEKQKIENSTGDSFIAAFAQFSKDHPGFVVHAQLGKVTVISIQSSFMVSQLVKDGLMDGPVNGTVNNERKNITFYDYFSILKKRVFKKESYLNISISLSQCLLCSNSKYFMKSHFCSHQYLLE